MTQATLTISGKIFRTGDEVITQLGHGLIIGLDPFGDEEIGVQFPEDGAILWFSWHDAAPREAEATPGGAL